MGKKTVCICITLKTRVKSENLKSFFKGYLKLNSLEMKRKISCHIYAWETLHKLVPKFSYDAIREYIDDERGLLCRVASQIRRATQLLKLIRDGMFVIQGPNLSNCLPRVLCATEHTDGSYLLEMATKKMVTTPDEPQLPSYPCDQRSNNITT